VYVNRNMVGAVVGVQPFGGEGLSGTGPKAGGPLYLYRLLAARPDDVLTRALPAEAGTAGTTSQSPPIASLLAWAQSHQDAALADACLNFSKRVPAHRAIELPGPTGERNVYSIAPRTSVLCLAQSDSDRLLQLAAVLAVGSRAIWPAEAQPLRDRLPSELRGHVVLARDPFAPAISFDAVLLHGGADQLRAIQAQLAQREGPVVSVERLAPGERAVPLERLVVERALSVNTAAAGGNASLMTIG